MHRRLSWIVFQVSRSAPCSISLCASAFCMDTPALLTSRSFQYGQGRGKSGLSAEQEEQLQRAVADLEADGGISVRT